LISRLGPAAIKGPHPNSKADTYSKLRAGCKKRASQSDTHSTEESRDRASNSMIADRPPGMPLVALLIRGAMDRPR
jgi:hypothetical protein